MSNGADFQLPAVKSIDIFICLCYNIFCRYIVQGTVPGGYECVIEG